MPDPSRADLTLDDAVCANGDAIEDLLHAVRRVESAVLHLQRADGSHRDLRGLLVPYRRRAAA